MPKVSVGLPVYNGEDYLKEALDSLLNQTFKDFELIISDNASTDATQEICESFTSLDKRIRYYRNQENLGAAKNYNRVFELAVGEYFKWASHDDLCAPTFLERCVEILELQPSVILAYTRTLIIDAQGNITAKYADNANFMAPNPYKRLNNHLLPDRGRHISPVFGVIRSSALKKTRLIGNYIGSDTVLLVHLILLGQFYEVPEELFFSTNPP